MALNLQRRWWSPMALAAVLGLLSALLMAADTGSKAAKSDQSSPDVATVEMFQAIQAGQINVRLIP